MFGAKPPYDPAAYPPFAVTVDLAVFTIRHDALQVLLIERGGEPFRGALALPGGFVHRDEDLYRAAARELAEETGLDADIDTWHLEQLASYGAPDRDPRMRVVTVAYVAVCAKLPGLRPGGDAAGAVVKPVETIERGAVRLAFDHERIVRDAAARLRSKLEYTALAAKFCPPAFTVGQLRRVYEVVWGVRLDPGNFHHDFEESGVFERTGGSAGAARPRRGRPGALWTVRRPMDGDPFASPVDRPPARRKRRRRVDDGAGMGGAGASSRLRGKPGSRLWEAVGSREHSDSPRLPRHQYVSLLREAVESYDYPTVVYDCQTGRELRHPDIGGVEEHIGALLRSPDPGGVRDGLSNVLYWGYARQPGRRGAKVRDFRNDVPADDPRLARFADLVRSLGELPLFTAAGPVLLDIKRLTLRQFGQMSFVTKILMFLDPRFPVLHMKVAKAFASGGFAPLANLRFDRGGIRLTGNNVRAYERWARWCREIAGLADDEPHAPRRVLRAVDVERALFTLADRPHLAARRLLAGPEGWTFDYTQGLDSRHETRVGGEPEHHEGGVAEHHGVEGGDPEQQRVDEPGGGEG